MPFEFVTHSSLFRFSLMLFLCAIIGCRPEGALRQTERDEPSKNPATIATSVSAQGRLLPASGIVQISAIPGDRIDAILVKVGDEVKAGQVLVRMRSEQLRTAELETSRTKLAETRRAAEVKRSESRLNIDAAHNRWRQAESQYRQAVEQKKLIETQSDESSTGQVASLRKQLERLVALRQDPLTRPMVGALELDARQMELEKIDASLKSSLLTATQAVEAAQLAVELARQGITAAEKAATLVEESFPTQSLEKQIELLELQVAQAPIVAPIAGNILSLLAEPGELSSGLPVLELADTERMICIAEVHEADVARLSIGQRVTLQSSALERPLEGRVQRIDRLVGMPQMRAPNPMARTDFRAVPITIELDETDSKLASRFVQLQVDATIHSPSE